MINNSVELSKISRITKNIYLSGIFPLDEDYKKIKELNIRYIISCIDRKMISEVHDRILAETPNMTILYLPYNDEINQNLWITNQNQINLFKYAGSVNDYNKIIEQVNYYKNKPMIEIGYNFINNSVEEGSNILIHCMAGISRSASLVIYFFMKKYHLSFIEAEKLVKQQRMIVNPNISFKNQLIKYQEMRDRFTVIDAQNIIDVMKNTILKK